MHTCKLNLYICRHNKQTKDMLKQLNIDLLLELKQELPKETFDKITSELKEYDSLVRELSGFKERVLSAVDWSKERSKKEITNK